MTIAYAADFKQFVTIWVAIRHFQTDEWRTESLFYSLQKASNYSPTSHSAEKHHPILRKTR